jgi:mannosyltransferase OCH1-like enzyme
MFNFKLKDNNIKNKNNFNPIIKKIKLKEKINSIIPLKIYQTWHSKELPPIMNNCINEIKFLNPEFEHYLFDDNECKEFIKNNFPESVLYAYNKLIPQAFKSDLWRYCVLYINGGIYLDVKFRCVNGFKLISLTEKEYFVKDLDKFGIYNALICCLPGNKILFNAINNIVYNVKHKFYGYRDLCVTGPHLLAKFFTTEQKINLEMQMNLLNNCHIITFNNIHILIMYKEYREEQNIYKINDLSYGELWKIRKIYL